MQMRLLVGAVGDLDSMWQSNEQHTLLGLPLPAVQLLLESDMLKVGPTLGQQTRAG